MKSVCDVLHGQTPNALYPFLWVHGVESEEELRREVQKIRESGIGGFWMTATFPPVLRMVRSSGSTRSCAKSFSAAKRWIMPARWRT